METSLSDRLQTHSMISLIDMFVLPATCDGSTAMGRDIGRLLSSVRTLFVSVRLTVIWKVLRSALTLLLFTRWILFLHETVYLFVVCCLLFVIQSVNAKKICAHVPSIQNKKRHTS